MVGMPAAQNNNRADQDASSGRHTANFQHPVSAQEHHSFMAAPTVEAAIHELMDFCWNVVYDLLDERGLLGDGLFVEEYTGIHSWLEDLTRYTVVHSRTVAVFFGHAAGGCHRVPPQPFGRRLSEKLQRPWVAD